MFSKHFFFFLIFVTIYYTAQSQNLWIDKGDYKQMQALNSEIRYLDPLRNGSLVVSDGKYFQIRDMENGQIEDSTIIHLPVDCIDWSSGGDSLLLSVNRFGTHIFDLKNKRFLDTLHVPFDTLDTGDRNEYVKLLSTYSFFSFNDSKIMIFAKANRICPPDYLDRTGLLIVYDTNDISDTLFKKIKLRSFTSDNNIVAFTHYGSFYSDFWETNFYTRSIYYCLPGPELIRAFHTEEIEDFPIGNIRILPGRKIVATFRDTYQDDKIFIIDVENRIFLDSIIVNQSRKQEVNDYCFSPDGRFIILSMTNPTNSYLQFIDISNKLTADSVYLPGLYHKIALIPDRNSIITGDKTGLLVLLEPALLDSDLNAHFICEHELVEVGEENRFLDYSTGNPDSWLWDFGDGNSSGEQNPTHTYNETGFFDVSLIVSNGSRKDTMTRQQYVFVRRTVHPEFTAVPREGKPPFNVLFFDSTKGLPTHRQWDFGDGETSTSQNPEHVYKTPGTYNVKLVAWNNTHKDSIIKQDYINIFHNFSADFSCDTLSGTIPFAVNFEDMSTGNPVEFHWDFGDGQVSGSQNPSYIYDHAGDFDIMLRIKGIEFKDSIFKPAHIIVKKNPYIEILLKKKAHEGTINRLEMTKSGDKIISAGSDSAVRIWEFPSGEMLAEYIFEEVPLSLYLHPGEERLAVGLIGSIRDSAYAKAAIIDMETGQITHELIPPPPYSEKEIYDVSVSFTDEPGVLVLSVIAAYRHIERTEKRGYTFTYNYEQNEILYSASGSCDFVFDKNSNMVFQQSFLNIHYLQRYDRPAGYSSDCDLSVIVDSVGHFVLKDDHGGDYKLYFDYSPIRAYDFSRDINYFCFHNNRDLKGKHYYTRCFAIDDLKKGLNDEYYELDYPHRLDDIAFTNNSEGLMLLGSGEYCLFDFIRDSAVFSVPYPELVNDWKALHFADRQNFVTGSNDGYLRVWKYDLISGVAYDENETISVFPNPFKEKATIRLNNSAGSLPLVCIYDVSGRKIAQPVFEEKGGGLYEAIIDGSRLYRGVYICCIEYGCRRKHIVLMKI